MQMETPVRSGPQFSREQKACIGSGEGAVGVPGRMREAIYQPWFPLQLTLNAEGPSCSGVFSQHLERPESCMNVP